MKPYILKTLGFVTDLLYPKVCPGCDNVLSKKEKSFGFCKKCSKKILIVGDNTCYKCGKILNDSTLEFCKACGTIDHKFDQGKAVYLYKGPIKNAMYKFKYSNRRCNAKVFVEDAMRLHGQWIASKGIDVIIPVPMFEKKKHKRGYNQAEVLAKFLSEKTGIPYNTEIVRRIINSKPLKQLNNLERRINLQNAFKINENVVKFKKVLVIDDIYTTGATMDELSSCLKAKGVEEVYCLSISIGENV